MTETSPPSESEPDSPNESTSKPLDGAESLFESMGRWCFQNEKIVLRWGAFLAPLLAILSLLGMCTRLREAIAVLWTVVPPLFFWFWYIYVVSRNQPDPELREHEWRVIDLSSKIWLGFAAALLVIVFH